MTILEVLVRLRDDLKLWVTNNLRVKVDKEDGKGLSSNDFTTEEKEKLASIDTYVDEKIQQRIDSLPKGDDGADGKSAYETAKEAGYTGTEEQFANKLAAITYETSVKEYGAKGDGSTNDTAAFQNALANNRVVDVPGGTYILNDTLVIRQNCRLNFSQDTVLKFTQTNGNCIEMRSSATLSGNHGVISVPYEFAGNVVSSVTTNDETRDTPPYTHWDPQWKRGRYIYDVCIIKPDTNGLCYMRAGSTCAGNGIYLSCDGDSTVRFMWGVMLQGVRIAGAFTNGIKVINYDLEGKEDSAWNHDMRIEAVIEGCETGVSLTNCNGPHLAVTVQPQAAQDGKTTYAKWGIYLNDCKFVDMSSSVVWDWDDSTTLYGTSDEYTFVAMYGNCAGLVLYDYAYYRINTDVRDRIYTDTASNLDRMTILQEPITRWFKPKEANNAVIPYFYDGFSEQPLVLQSKLKEYFDTQTVNGFDDVLSVATDENGYIFGDNGYAPGRFESMGSGTTIVTDNDSSTYYRVTGFIKCKRGDKFNARHLSFARQDGYTGVVIYDQNYKRLTSVTAELIINNKYASAISDYTPTDIGCSFIIQQQGVVYVRMIYHISDIGKFPAIAINQDLADKEYGFLSDDIKVDDDNIESIKLNTLQTRVDNVDRRLNNLSVTTGQVDFILPTEVEGEPLLFDDALYAQNVVLTSPSGSTFKLTVSDDGVLSATAFIE